MVESWYISHHRFLWGLCCPSVCRLLFLAVRLFFLDIWIYMYQMYRLDEQNDFPSLFLVDDLDNEYDSSINDTIIPNLIYDIGNQLWFNISLKNVNNILSKLAHYNRSLIFFVRSMLPKCVFDFFLFYNFYHAVLLPFTLFLGYLDLHVPNEPSWSTEWFYLAFSDR